MWLHELDAQAKERGEDFKIHFFQMRMEVGSYNKHKHCYNVLLIYDMFYYIQTTNLTFIGRVDKKSTLQ